MIHFCLPHWYYQNVAELIPSQHLVAPSMARKYFFDHPHDPRTDPAGRLPRIKLNRTKTQQSGTAHAHIPGSLMFAARLVAHLRAHFLLPGSLYGLF